MLTTSHYSINGLQQDYLYLFSFSACALWCAWTSIGKPSFLFPWKPGRSEVSHSSLSMDIWTLSSNFYSRSFPVRFIILVSNSNWQQIPGQSLGSAMNGFPSTAPWSSACAGWGSELQWSSSECPASPQSLLQLVVSISSGCRMFVSAKGGVKPMSLT